MRREFAIVMAILGISLLINHTDAYTIFLGLVDTCVACRIYYLNRNK